MVVVRNIDARLKKLELRKGTLPADPRIGIIKGPIDLDIEAFEMGARMGDIIVTTTFEWDGEAPVVVAPVRAESEMDEDLRAYLDRLTSEVVRLGDKQDIAGARTF